MQGSSAVKKMVPRYLTCRSLRGRVGEQIMADLPHDRLKEEPQFTHCGVDIFGPFLIKERRNTLKRYRALFTCFTSRAIHIEMIKNMNTDSFILALRRFISNKIQSHWRKKFLPTLQDRQKWKAPLRNFCVGDIVTLKEDTHVTIGDLQR